MTKAVRVRTVRERAATEAARLRLPVRVVAHNLLKDIDDRRECRGPFVLWTPAEEKLLAEIWDPDAAKAVAEQLGRSVGAVRNKAKALGLYRHPRRDFTPADRTGKPRAPAWSPEDVATMKAEYETCADVGVLADRLGRSRDAVILKAGVLGLHRVTPRADVRPVSEAVVRALHGLGWSDTAIANELQVRQEQVSGVRRRLGLVSNYGFDPGSRPNRGKS